MTPNVNIYGAHSTWLHVFPVSGYNTENKNFVAAWQTIAGGINANKVDYTKPLDNSICYAAIADDAPAAGAYFAAGDDLNNPVENLPFKEDFFVSAGDYGSGLFNSIPYYDITDNFPQKYTYDITSNPVSNNPNMGLKPLCSVSLKDLVLCVYVGGFNADFSSYAFSTYNGYKQQYSASHPNITTVYAVPYCRNENSNTRFALTNSESYNFSGFSRMNLYTLPNNLLPQYDYFANINRDNGLVFNIWGIPADRGCITFFSASSNYIYRAFGQGGTFTAVNGNLYYSRPWGAAYREHAGNDWIRRAAASFGCFFVDRTQHAQSAAYASENMCLGTIDENGLCHGDYTTGADNTEQPQYTWISTNESTYNPDMPIDDTIYDWQAHINEGAGVKSCNRRYAIDGTTVQALKAELATALNHFQSNPVFPAASLEGNSLAGFLTNNPVDCIVSLKKFPVTDIVTDIGVDTNLVFGGYTSNTLSGRPISTTAAVKVYDFEFSPENRNTFNFNFYKDNSGYHETFLDYEPFSHAELFIPYCGSVPISLADCKGFTIIVKLIIDLITGACTAFVFRKTSKGLQPLTSISGQAGTDVSISGIQQATLDSQITNANLQYKAAQLQKENAIVGGFTSAAVSASTGNLAGVAGTAVNMAYNIQQADINLSAANYNATHIQVPFKQLSASTGVISLAYDQGCKLTLYRPILSDDYNPEVYANTIGFACLKNGVVNDFSGLTIGEINLDGVPCTAEEKQMIYNDFARGVIL